MLVAQHWLATTWKNRMLYWILPNRIPAIWLPPTLPNVYALTSLLESSTGISHSWSSLRWMLDASHGRIDSRTTLQLVSRHSPVHARCHAYITDSMGYHKVGNPSTHQPAVTLHLYAPPFNECTVWCDENKSSLGPTPKLARSCNYSEYGQVVEDDDTR
jgi:hypothetical protein